MVLAALWAVPALLMAQPNLTDAAGKKQGPWKKLDADGKLKYEGQFKDNIPVGKFTYYYPSGKVKMVSVYSANGTITRAKTYDEAYGKLMAEGKYINEKKDSIWTYYTLDEKLDSQLISTESYSKGVKNGPWKTFYPNGRLFSSKTYKNDVLEGPWEEFFEDGKQKLKAMYVKGLLDGVAVYYTAEGKKMTEGKFVKGLRNGPWITYTPEGKIVVEKYNMGQLIEPNKKDTKTTPKPGGVK